MAVAKTLARLRLGNSKGYKKAVTIKAATTLKVEGLTAHAGRTIRKDVSLFTAPCTTAFPEYPREVQKDNAPAATTREPTATMPINRLKRKRHTGISTNGMRTPLPAMQIAAEPVCAPSSKGRRTCDVFDSRQGRPFTQQAKDMLAGDPALPASPRRSVGC